MEEGTGLGIAVVLFCVLVFVLAGMMSLGIRMLPEYTRGVVFRLGG
jgi:regulator of protease activity HflC (stomatin/prohibitin superfamily)